MSAFDKALVLITLAALVAVAMWIWAFARACGKRNEQEARAEQAESELRGVLKQYASVAQENYRNERQSARWESGCHRREDQLRAIASILDREGGLSKETSAILSERINRISFEPCDASDPTTVEWRP